MVKKTSASIKLPLSRDEVADRSAVAATSLVQLLQGLGTKVEVQQVKEAIESALGIPLSALPLERPDSAKKVKDYPTVFRVVTDIRNDASSNLKPNLASWLSFLCREVTQQVSKEPLDGRDFGAALSGMEDVAAENATNRFIAMLSARAGYSSSDARKLTVEMDVISVAAPVFARACEEVSALVWERLEPVLAAKAKGTLDNGTGPSGDLEG